MAERGIGPGVCWEKSEVSPEDVVNIWRELNPLVAGADGLWANLESAFRLAVEGHALEFDGILIWKEDTDVLVRLPSGRALRYRSVELSANGELTCEHRGTRSRTWGPKLVQNVVQALARDVLADALVRCERAGLKCVLHVHDEIVIEFDDKVDVEKLEEIMTTPPAWAPDLPLAVKIVTGERYT